MPVQQIRTAAELQSYISCCKRVSGEINDRHDIIVNISLNNILIQRGLVTREQRREDRKMVKTAHDESPSAQSTGDPRS